MRDYIRDIEVVNESPGDSPLSEFTIRH
jgi:hypothetical protein